MQITHINFAKGFRGGERQTQLLIEKLSLEGFEQTLLVRNGSELIQRCKNISKLKIIAITKPYILHINTIKYSSIIHAHETKAAQFAYFAHLFFKIPYIITRRVDNPIRHNLLNIKMYTQASYNVALSKAIKEEIFKVAPKAKIEIIPSAFSELEVDPTNANVIKKRFENKFLIGHIGALVDIHKGQSFLIEAARDLEKEYPDIHFILLGRGEDEEKFKTQAKGLTNITFEGFVENVNDYVNCFDLFVFPSQNEGLGSILFDVMQLDVPIIASNVGGIPDIITNHENGLLIPKCNSNAIKEAIITLYTNIEIRNRFTQNAKKDLEKFSPKNMAHSYINLYNDFLH